MRVLRKREESCRWVGDLVLRSGIGDKGTARGVRSVYSESQLLHISTRVQIGHQIHFLVCVEICRWKLS